MQSLEKVRKDYLIFLVLHITVSLILAIVISSTPRLVMFDYTPSFTVYFLGTFVIWGLLTGVFFGTAFIIYGLYQKFSNERTFNPKQFAAIFLIGALVFGSSMAAGHLLGEQEREDYEAQRCTNVLETRTSVTDKAVKIPTNCLEELREIEGLEDLEEGERVKKTQSGFVVSE